MEYFSLDKDHFVFKTHCDAVLIPVASKKYRNAKKRNLKNIRKISCGKMLKYERRCSSLMASKSKKDALFQLGPFIKSIITLQSKICT